MSRTEESQRREADRKERFHARKWYEGIMAKQKTHMGGAVTETELLIANIDRSVTREVRAELNQATVDEYAECEGEWSETKPIDVWWDGGKACYASDGGHRLAAKEKNGKKKILCRVHRCESDEAALTLARLHAYGPANAGHGLKRSPEDKRATVKACIALPEYAGESDRRVAEICKVGKWLVGQVRAEIAGAPKPAPRTVHAAQPSPPPEPAQPSASGRATARESDPAPAVPAAAKSTPVPSAEDDEPKPTTGVVARPLAKADKLLLDARGRRVPDALAPAFKLGRAFATDLRGVAGELVEAVKAAVSEPYGAALGAMVPNVEGDIKKAMTDATSALPWACCPHVDQATGQHIVEGKCRVCVQNRGWITRHQWHQLSDPIKGLIDEHAEPDAEREAA